MNPDKKKISAFVDEKCASIIDRKRGLLEEIRRSYADKQDYTTVAFISGILNSPNCDFKISDVMLIGPTRNTK
jgi:hypothetical protein